MEMLYTVSILYGLLNIAFGLLGWINKGSVMSLLAGGIAGILAIVGAIIAKRNPVLGYAIVIVVSIAMIARFLPLYLRDTSKIYPHLILIAASFIVIALLLCWQFLGRKA